MAIYCMSDIHGEYEKYMRMLEKISFSTDDTLYVIGDVVDRGAQGIKILQDMMRRPNVVPLVGNHEYMAIQCLGFLTMEITENSISKFNDDMVEAISNWQLNGGTSTIKEFGTLSAEEKRAVLEYLGEFELCEEVCVGGSNYIFVHGGLNNFSTNRPLEDYGLHELIFHSPDYNCVYFSDRYLVTGHTPTRLIHGRDTIFRRNNHIAIDCGAAIGGKLGTICLDTGEEFFV